MVKYRFVEDLTSDVMFEAYGKNLKEVFENAAEALFSVICQLDKVKAEVCKNFEIKADDVKDLMLNWLQGLIASVDVDELFYSKFEIKEISEKHLKAVCCGEPIKPEKGETVVKAVTYYGFSFEKTKTGYKARVSLDI